MCIVGIVTAGVAAAVLAVAASADMVGGIVVTGTDTVGINHDQSLKQAAYL